MWIHTYSVDWKTQSCGIWCCRIWKNGESSVEHLLELHHIFGLQLKTIYLKHAYEYALEDIPAGKSWRVCYKHSTEIYANLVSLIHNVSGPLNFGCILLDCGLISSSQSICWIGKGSAIQVFCAFPEAQDELPHSANQNFMLPNSNLAAEFIWSELFSKVYEQYTNESGSGELYLSRQEFLHSLNLTTVGTMTALHWLKNLGFSFDVQKSIFQQPAWKPRKCCWLDRVL